MDVVVDIPVSSVQYTTWLRTSYVGLSMASKAGTPLVEQTELGVDQEDAIVNLLDEAVREVSKLFLTRQGDATGVAFEYNGTNAIYRFHECEPFLNQSTAIKSALNEDVKNAIYYYVTFLWFTMKSNKDMMQYLLTRYEKLASNIDRSLYKLHD